jgi:hypothetical protein
MKNYLLNLVLILALLPACTILSEQPFYYKEPLDKSFDWTGNWELFEVKITDGGNRAELLEITKEDNYYQLSFVSSQGERDLEVRLHPFYIGKNWLMDVAMRKIDNQDEPFVHLLFKLEKVNDNTFNILEMDFKKEISQELTPLAFKRSGLDDKSYTLTDSQASINAWLNQKIKTTMKFKKTFYLERR